MLHLVNSGRATLTGWSGLVSKEMALIPRSAERHKPLQRREVSQSFVWTQCWGRNSLGFSATSINRLLVNYMISSVRFVKVLN